MVVNFLFYFHFKDKTIQPYSVLMTVLTRTLHTSLAAWLTCVDPTSHPGELSLGGGPCLQSQHSQHWRHTARGRLQQDDFCMTLSQVSLELSSQWSRDYQVAEATALLCHTDTAQGKHNAIMCLYGIK